MLQCATWRRTACIRNPQRLQSPATPALRLALSNSDCATGEGLRHVAAVQLRGRIGSVCTAGADLSLGCAAVGRSLIADRCRLFRHNLPHPL